MGDLIHHHKPDICSTLTSREECNMLLDTISYITYNEWYTPSRQSSLQQDYISKRTHLISYVQRRFGFSSYLEIGCATDDNFAKLRPQFNDAICVDPELGKAHMIPLNTHKYF